MPDFRHIVFVTHGLSVGGAEKLLLSLIRSLQSSPCRTVVFSTGRARDLQDEYEQSCDRLVICPHRWAFDISLIPRLARVVNAEHADVVISNLFYADIVAGTARQFTSSPLISWQHAAPSTDPKNNRWYHRRAFRLVEPRFERFVCCSDYLCSDLESTFHLERERMTTIQNWVDTDRFVPRDRDPDRNGFTVGSTARFASGKGHEQLLRAFRRVRETIEDARLVLVGDGPTRPRLERMAAEYGMMDSVRFLGVRHDVYELLPEFDVFVLASRAEASPVCLLEAMSCARPVVAYDIPGVRESVIHGQTGLLCPVGDEAAFASRLVELGRNRALGVELGQAGRREVGRRFERTRQIGKFLDLVDSVVEGQ